MSNKKKFRGFFKSLRVRLFVLFLLIGILPSAVIRIGMLNSYEKKAVSNRSIDILSQAKILTNQIVFNDYLNDSSSEIINAQLEQLSNIYAGRIMVIDGNFRIIKDTYSLDTGKTIVSEEVMQSFRGEEISKYDSQNGYIEMTVPLTKPESKEILGVLLVSVSTDSIMLNKDYLESSAWIIEVFDAMIIILLSLFLSGLLVRPFGRMEKEIVEIQNGYKTELDVPSYLEITEYLDPFQPVVWQNERSLTNRGKNLYQMCPMIKDTSDFDESIGRFPKWSGRCSGRVIQRIYVRYRK